MIFLIVHNTNLINTILITIYDRNTKSFYSFYSLKFETLSSSWTLIFGLKFVEFEVRIC